VYFSVIIPTCNRTELLDTCLSLLQLQELAVDYEVIVSDDSNTNSTRLLINNKYPYVIWIQGPQQGPAANRNKGASIAKGKWLVFLDDDVKPDTNLLISYSTAINAHPNISAFEGAIYPDDWKLLKLDMAECPINTTGGCFWSANICIEKSFFEQIGMFDDSFKIAAQEDQEIYNRIRDISLIIFVSDAKVVHPVRVPSVLDKLNRLPQSLNSWIFFYKKNHSWVQVFREAYKSQLIALANAISKKFIKTSFIHLITLLILFPSITLSAYKFKSNSKI
jgi:GT2 family glycosyltransferase